MYLVIAGLGGIGQALARIATTKGNNVAVIDSDLEKCSALLEEYDLRAISGDATNITTLEEAGISQADAFIGATGDDAINLMACTIAKRCGVKTQVAVVNEKEHESLFRESGFRICENRDELAARNLLLSLTNPDAQILATIDGGCIFEVTVREGSKGVDKMVKEMSGGKDELYVAIRRDGNLIIPNGDTVFKPGDTIAVFTKKESEEKSVARMNDLFL